MSLQKQGGEKAEIDDVAMQMQHEPQFQQFDPATYMMARGSLAETESNEFGFQANNSNPTQQMQQVYWEEF